MRRTRAGRRSTFATPGNSAHEYYDKTKSRQPVSTPIGGRGRDRSLRALYSQFAAHGIYLILGRFHSYRKLYDVTRRMAEQLTFRPAALKPYAAETSLFDGLPIADAVHRIKRRGLYEELSLPAETLQAIRRFSLLSPCKRWKLNDPADGHFLAGQVNNGRLPDGRLVAVADVVSPRSCPALIEVARDRNILALFRRCKGYAPRRVVVRLFWYFAVEASHPANALLPNRGGLYHYDVPGPDSLYVFFYLTDTDRDSGAHAAVEGSHRCKALSMLFGTRYRSDAEIHDHYGEALETIIEGPAGLGFAEDPFCFHKFCHIRKNNRLMLQLQYY